MAKAKQDFELEVKGGPKGTRRMKFKAGEDYDLKALGIEGHSFFGPGPIKKEPQPGVEPEPAKEPDDKKGGKI